MADGFTLNMPSWLEAPEVWNTVTLGGLALPGVCRVKVKPARKVDVKAGAGIDGAALTDKGAEPAKVTITCRIWTSDQWGEIENVTNAVFPLGGKMKPQPLDIAHPQTNLYSIKSIYITDIEDNGPDDDGGYSFTFNCLEFKPPKAKGTNSPKKAKDASAQDAWYQTSVGPPADPKLAAAREKAARAFGDSGDGLGQAGSPAAIGGPPKPSDDPAGWAP